MKEAAHCKEFFRRDDPERPAGATGREIIKNYVKLCGIIKPLVI
jgi:hypothetical protein